MRSGKPCQREAEPQSIRCRIHGAGGGRPSGSAQHPNTRAAAVEGRRRYLDRMRQAKAAGLIDKIPVGRRARDLPPLSKDRKIRRAQRIIEARMEERAVVRRWGEGLTKAERLGSATDDALEVVQRILALGVDPTDPRVLAIVKDTALTVISVPARLDAAALAAQSGALSGLDDDQFDGRLDRALARLAQFEAEAQENLEEVAEDGVDVEAEVEGEPGSAALGDLFSVLK
jgi:hypothetical protein